MRKPIIAITPQCRDIPNFPFKLNLYCTNNANTDWMLKCGAIPVMAPFLSAEDAEEFIQHCDGLFMTGGADVDPARYGREKQPYCDVTEPDRDASDLALMAAALKYNKPILCICRGSQIGNVYFGGTLYQDLKTELGDKITHPDYATHNLEVSHTINILKDSPLYKLLGEEKMGINSLHHQGVKDLGEGVIPMATADDGLVESWYYDKDGQWIRAYQWHPEFQDENRHNVPIIKDFIDRCTAKMK